MGPDSSETRGARREARLAVAVTDARGRPTRAYGLTRWLARVAPRSARGHVSIALVSDVQIQRLNRTYRHKDVPTDVLSFPVRASPRAHRDSTLGDIAIATGVARRQARAGGHSYAAELRILALHGLLHLLGYDHERPGDRARMERIERRLRAKGGLRAGLIERATEQS